MEDNFYKASTERLIAPAKQHQEKLRRDKNAYERERPLITAVMADIKQEIDKLEKIDSIKTQDDPEAFMREVIANKQICNILRRELKAMEVKVKMFDCKELK